MPIFAFMTRWVFCILLSCGISSYAQKGVAVDFKFNSIFEGKPTLSFFYYDITIKNSTSQTINVIIPNWFNSIIPSSGKLWSGEINSFGKVNGYKLYELDGNNSFTVFILKPNEKVLIKDFEIETFDEKMAQKLSTGMKLIIASEISIDKYTVGEFVADSKLHKDYLVYKIKGDEKTISVKTKK
jgi:hypothetical protein